MAYKCLFLDNEVYTAQDVNDALSSIASGGVSGYPFGISALEDLNSAINTLISGGTDYRGTSCLLVNDGGEYKISEGACIMNDGTQIIFDYEGYVIEHEDGVKQYVYLERDVLHNTINVVVSETAGGQDTIAIAEILADGTVIDRRKFAKAKISLLAEPENIGITKHITHASIRQGESFEVDLGFDGWKYIISNQESGISFCHKLEDGSTATGFPVTKDQTQEYGINVSRQGSVIRIINVNHFNSGAFDLNIEVR